MKALDIVEPRIPLPDPAAAARGPGLLIAAPGSYFLVADVVGVAGAAGITIDASDVTLDLNGFSVIGVPGSLDGIVVLPVGGGLDQTNISIFNGIVRDWGEDGVDAIDAANSQVYDLRVSNNDGDGIRLGVGGVITRCVANTNAAAGEDGIEIGGVGLVSHCTLFQNDVGIRAGLGSTVEHCSISAVTLGGIIAAENTTIRNCTLSFVFDLSGGGTGGGINVGSGCRVVGNLVNTGPILGGADGIRVGGTGNEIKDNTVRIIGMGISGIEVTAAGNLIVGNSVTSAGALVSYAIVAGNTAGPIVDAATIAGSMNPHANYDY